MKKLVILGLLGMVVASTFTGCIRTKGNSTQVMSGILELTQEVTTKEHTEASTKEQTTEIQTEAPTKEQTSEIQTEAPTKEQTTEIQTEAPTKEQTSEIQTEASTEAPTQNTVAIVNRMFKEADEYFLQNDGKCQDILDEIVFNYPEYIDKVEERRNYYMEYPDGTVLLLYEEAFDYTYIYGPFFKYDTKRKFEDNYGNIYYDYAKAIMSETNVGENDKYVVFNAEGKYDTFEGKIVCHKEVDEINEFHAEVYGDGELIYTSETINGYSKPLTFTANIAGYELIKVCLVREDDYLTIAKSQPSVALVDAMLYNKVLPEFVPFVPIEE